MPQQRQVPAPSGVQVGRVASGHLGVWGFRVRVLRFRAKALGNRACIRLLESRACGL